MRVTTVQELIDELSKLPPDTKIIKQTSNSMEMGNSMVSGAYVSIGKYKEKEETFTDAFDGGSYSSTVFVPDEEEGTDHVKIG